MRMTDRRRQVGGVGAVVAAFWLGFVCGGGGGVLSEAAASGQPPGEPAPASQQPPGEPAPVPDEPDPASQPADPASQPPEEQAPAPVDPAQADAVPDEESPPADPGPEESVQEDPETGPEPPLVQDRPRDFTARTGIVLYFVRQDAESTFEETMTRVAEAFAASESEERQEQADGWSMYKAEEPLADGVRLYVSWIDPVVPRADYWVPGILSEAFPTEAQTLYETYAGAFADGQILLNLGPVRGP